jgi:hypothetical protein
MNCPEHPDIELRRENYYKTGFCSKCLKHHRMCTEVQFMNICDRLEGHDGAHRDASGKEWTSPKWKVGK